VAAEKTGVCPDSGIAGGHERPDLNAARRLYKIRREGQWRETR
jgi:hypothetical protein